MTPERESRAKRAYAFSDEQVFQAITRLLVEGGIASVSLPTIAREIGFTHQALTYRFESRAGLLSAYASWLWPLSHRNQTALRTDTRSPLDALHSIMLMPLVPELTGIRGQSSPAAFVFVTIECQRDPVLRETLAEYIEVVLDRMRAIIADAQERGLLIKASPDEIAEALLYAITGVAVYCAGASVEDAWTQMEHVYTATLRPYLIGN